MEFILQEIADIFRHDFMIRAFLSGILIAITCSFLGIFLVLKKQSMIGDGLAHVSFAAIAISLFFHKESLFISIPIVIIAGILIIKLNEYAGVHADAAIGLISSFSVALGTMIASLSSGFNVDLFSYLFGSILVITKQELYLSMALCFGVLGIIIFYYDELFAITYDEEFAQIQGINTNFFNYLISTLTSVTIVLGIKAIGTMLISSLIIFPTVSALQISKNFKMTIINSSIISSLCLVLGIILSYIFNLPTGSTIVFLNGVVFLILFLIKKLK